MTRILRRSFRLVLCLPLAILVIEHTIAALYWSEILSQSSFAFPVDSDTARKNVFTQGSVPRTAMTTPISLSTLTSTTGTAEINSSSGSGGASLCRDPLIRVANKEVISPPIPFQQSQGIPKVVHQTSKSVCLTRSFAKAMIQWKQWEDWAYYLHDDDAMMRLFRHHSADFPGLAKVVERCLPYGTIKADLWRYLLLWVYGGVYVDIDAVPAKWTPALLQPNDDAFFVVEQFHMLSQYFMAVTPRHPLMWYAIQHSLLNLQRATDTGRLPAAMTTGPHALHQAYRSFRQDAGEFVDEARTGTKPVWAGRFVGSYGRTVTIMGVAANQNEYIDRDVIGSLKRLEYGKLGMTFHQDDRKNLSSPSCLKVIMDSYYL